MRSRSIRIVWHGRHSRSPRPADRTCHEGQGRSIPRRCPIRLPDIVKLQSVPPLLYSRQTPPWGTIGPASAVVDDEATNANAEDATSAASFLLSCFHGFL